MQHFRQFCMKKRAGLLRHRKLDFETVRDAACAQIVIANVSIIYRMPISAIMNERRGRQKVSDARQVSQYLCHIGFQQSFSTIGKIFKRDRTSVAHACQRVEGERDKPKNDLAIECLEWGVMALARSLELTKDDDPC